MFLICALLFDGDLNALNAKQQISYVIQRRLLCNYWRFGVWKVLDCRLRLATGASAQVFTVSALFQGAVARTSQEMTVVVTGRLSGHNSHRVRPAGTDGPLPIGFLDGPVLLVATRAESSLFRYDDSRLGCRAHFDSSAEPSKFVKDLPIIVIIVRAIDTHLLL